MMRSDCSSVVRKYNSKQFAKNTTKVASQFRPGTVRSLQLSGALYVKGDDVAGACLHPMLTSLPSVHVHV